MRAFLVTKQTLRTDPVDVATDPAALAPNPAKGLGSCSSSLLEELEESELEPGSAMAGWANCKLASLLGPQSRASDCHDQGATGFHYKIPMVRKAFKTKGGHRQHTTKDQLLNL